MTQEGHVPQAGPSKPKRARFDAGSQRAVPLPTNLDVERYALARGLEIAAMGKAMKASRDSGAQRAFQSLPRHLRRRAASHNIRRLPKRLRAKAKIEMLQDQAKVLKKKKFRQLSIAKRRKLLRATRLETLHGRQRERAWLETHIWHAKRMKMVDIWGYRLAHTSTDKAFRPSHRAAMHGVIVHDASYMQTLELTGEFEDLRFVLGRICDLSGLLPYSKRYIEGVRACDTLLYASRSWPTGLIGPGQVIWKCTNADVVPNEPQQRSLYLRFHPAMLQAVETATQDALYDCVEVKRVAFYERHMALDLPRPPEPPKILRQYRTFCTFEITGPMATDTIKACLRLSPDNTSEAQQAWRNLNTPAATPSGMIVSVNVRDPRLHFPPALSRSEKSHGKSTLVVPSSGIASNERFWDAEQRQKIRVPKYSKRELDTRRADHLVPGTRLDSQADDEVIPIMLIQRSLAAREANATKSHTNKAAVSGWTLIVPAGWGSAFWHSLAFADARVGGLRERSQQYFEAGCASFPKDYACTTAFKAAIDAKAKEMSAKWHRTPPAKRVNFDKLKTKSPWRPDIQTAAAFPEGVWPFSGPAIHIPSSDSYRGVQVPWLMSGSLVSQSLDEAMREFPGESGIFPGDVLRVSDYKAVCKRVEDAVSSITQKRRSEQPRLNYGAQGIYLPAACVKFRLDTLARGSPKYNAMVYILTPEQAKDVRIRLADKQKRTSPLEKATQRERKSKRTENGSDKLGAQTAGFQVSRLPEDSDFESKDSDDEDEYPTPSDGALIGYVTTGNLSLARGRGQGIGTASFLAVAMLQGGEAGLKLRKQDPRNLVLFRNPAGHVYRPASLVVLE